jgi:hypothetical protein
MKKGLDALVDLFQIADVLVAGLFDFRTCLGLGEAIRAALQLRTASISARRASGARLIGIRLRAFDGGIALALLALSERSAAAHGSCQGHDHKDHGGWLLTYVLLCVANSDNTRFVPGIHARIGFFCVRDL